MMRALILFLVSLAACVPQPVVLPAAESPEAPFAEEQVVRPAQEELPEVILPQEEVAEQALPTPDEPPETVPVGSGVQCPDGYSFAGGYCVEDACQNKQVKCMVSGSLIKRPDCECWIYLGEPICSIKAAEETRIKSPLCQRKGQVGGVCGAYDSNKKHCVLK